MVDDWCVRYSINNDRDDRRVFRFVMKYLMSYRGSDKIYDFLNEPVVRTIESTRLSITVKPFVGIDVELSIPNIKM